MMVLRAGCDSGPDPRSCAGGRVHGGGAGAEGVRGGRAQHGELPRAAVRALAAAVRAGLLCLSRRRRRPEQAAQ